LTKGSVQHEGVYLWSYQDLHDLERALENWFERYNRWKPHSALGRKDALGNLPAPGSVPWNEAA
jgi:transposase InsO family protein